MVSQRYLLDKPHFKDISMIQICNKDFELPNFANISRSVILGISYMFAFS